MSCVCLAQLLALCGSVAFWQVSHLERSVSAELRRRRGETEEREEKEKGPSSKTKVVRWTTLVLCVLETRFKAVWPLVLQTNVLVVRTHVFSLMRLMAKDKGDE